MEKQYDSLFEKAVDETNNLKKFFGNKRIEVVSSAINGDTETVKIKIKNNDDIIQIFHNGDEINIFLNKESFDQFRPERALTLDGAIHILSNLFDEPIEELNFTPHTYNILKRGGINNKFELKNMGFHDIAKIKFMNSKALQEIENKLNITFE